MRRCTILIVLTLLSIVASAWAAGKPASPPMPETPKNYFPIGVWFFNEDDSTYTGKKLDNISAKEYYAKAFADLSAHGVNMAILNWIPQEHAKIALDAAAMHGVKCITHLPAVDQAVRRKSTDVKQLTNIAKTEITPIKTHKALIGYYIKDEPVNTSEMANSVRAAKTALARLDPKKPSFCCVTGNFSKVAQVVRDPILLANVYPIASNGKFDAQGYMQEIQRLVTIANGRPLWLIVQTFGKQGSWAVPTPEQVEGQVWLAIAGGAKGIGYFIYQSTGKTQGENLKGLVDPKLEATDGRWARIAELNKSLNAISPILHNLKAYKGKTRFELPSTVIFREFSDPAGSRYLLAVNTDINEPVKFNLPGVNTQDVLSGQEISGDISIRPGSGLLLKIITNTTEKH